VARGVPARCAGFAQLVVRLLYARFGVHT
jgi:hypothetical protein